MKLWGVMGGTMLAAMVLVAGPGAAGPDAGSGDPAKGKVVYANHNPKCSLCHKIGDTGGKTGPELTAVGAKRDAAWLAKYLANPKAADPKNKMPAVKAKGQDLDDLVAYLLTLKGK